MVSAGKRNQRIAFWTVSYIINAAGHRSEVRTFFGSVWAKVLPVSARELEIAKGFSTQVTYVASILFNEEITNSMIVTWGDKTLSIQGVVDPDSMRTELRLYCSEVVAAGGGT